MKILHLISQRPDSTGSGIYLQAMLREAAAHGHRNALVAGIDGGRRAGLPGVAQKNCTWVEFDGRDIEGRIVGMSDAMPYASRRFRDLQPDDLARYEQAFAAKLKTAAAAFAPDLVHAHHLWLVSAVARRVLPALPVVATCHGSDLRQFQSLGHLRGRVAEACRRLDGIMALSRAQQAEIASLYGLPAARVDVVGAGYDARLFRAGPKPAPDPVRLVYAGKLSRAKGVPWLLRALRPIETPAWQLDLVGGGSGAEAAHCRKLAREAGMRVRLHAPMPQGQLADILRQAHLFVLPSFFEGLPLVVLEALASGCRLVVTDLPGVAELLGPEKNPLVSLVVRPRLEAVDRPVAADEKGFETRLTQALRHQLTAARTVPAPDMTPVARRLGAFTWSRVFERVARVYGRAGGARTTAEGTKSN